MVSNGCWFVVMGSVIIRSWIVHGVLARGLGPGCVAQSGGTEPFRVALPMGVLGVADEPDHLVTHDVQCMIEVHL